MQNAGNSFTLAAAIEPVAGGSVTDARTERFDLSGAVNDGDTWNFSYLSAQDTSVIDLRICGLIATRDSQAHKRQADNS